MRLSDFAIYAEDGFRDPRQTNFRCLHVGEAVRMELARRGQIVAPFRKICLNLYNEEAQFPRRPVTNIFGIAEMRAGVAESVMTSDYPSFRSHLVGTMKQAIMRSAEKLDWSPASLVTILTDIGERERVFQYRLESLSRISRATCHRIDVIYEMTEHETVLSATIFTASGHRLREEIIARDPRPMPLELFFPVRSTAVKDGRMTFYDHEKKPLAELDLAADTKGPSC